MRITERDNQIIEFLKKCPCDSFTIHDVFFSEISQRVCNERLKKLFDGQIVKRTREDVIRPYTYYMTKKPKLLEHCNCVAKTYLWLLKNDYKILTYHTELLIGNVRPDVIYKIKKNNKEGYLFVEVELSNNNVNKKVQKYEELYTSDKYKDYFERMPKILYFANRTVSNKYLDIINIKLKEL